MSVVINTNSSATIAANNLAESNRMLQKSLNRLSSGSKIVNASDDAGGVAVAARLGAASQRTSGVIGNISSALSFLQQQDSALKTGSKLMQRMNELQVLYRDSTKSATDKGQYETEFDKLKAQYYSAVKGAQFNGKDLMSASGALAVTINEGMDTYSLSNLSTEIRDSRTWAITDGGNYALAEGNKSFTTLETALDSGGTHIVDSSGNLVLTVGSRSAVTIALDAGDNMSAIVTKINASGAAVTASMNSDGFLKITGKVEGEAIALTGSTTATTTALGIAGASATAQTDHSKSEIDSIATARAKNGADQSVLQYYSELATASKTNFESAISRIMDVDVAQESTQLARWNTLVQAGTAMMAQANGSTLSALSLLKG